MFASNLISVIFSAKPTDAFRDSDVGIGIMYKYDGSLFNLKRPQACTKDLTDTINVFLFADDWALNTACEEDMQHSVDKFSEACNNFGLSISTKITEVIHQPTPG